MRLPFGHTKPRRDRRFDGDRAILRVLGVTAARVLGVAATLALAGPSLDGDLSAQSRADRTQSYLESYHELRLFNGAALVVDQGEVLYRGALGLADVPGAVPASESTRFRIASLTKQFTAALILRLEEEGLVDVEASVRTYVPEYPEPNGDRITLHQLLTHSSGLPSYTDLPEFGESEEAVAHTPEQLLALTWDRPLDFEPGTRFRYSNSGYVLLGWIAERVTGQSYEDALRTYVLDALGLTDTGYDHWRVAPDGHAAGHLRRLDGYESAREIDPTVPYAAGMLYSTVDDLRAWTAALLGWSADSPFTDPETVGRMLEPQIDDYAYGIVSRRGVFGRESEVHVVEHTGGIAGFRAVVRAFPEQHRLIILLDNTSSDLRPILTGLTNILWGSFAEPPKPAIAERILPIIQSGGVEAALGRYQNWKQTRPDEYDYGPGQLMALANHFRESDPSVSVALLEALAEETPEAPMIRYALAELSLETGDTARALAEIETALTYNPGVPQLLALLPAGLEVDPVLRVPTIPMEPDQLAAFIGEYRIDPATTLQVTLEEDGLYAARTGEPAFRLLAQGPTAFLLHGSKLQLVFELAGDQTTAVSIVESGQRVTFPKIEGPR